VSAGDLGKSSDRFEGQRLTLAEMVAILRWMRIGEMAETIGCGLECDIGKPEATRQVLGR